jgi:hypothetical protein
VTRDVIIDYEAGRQWPADYSIDWATVSDPQDVLQVVDGLWTSGPNGIHPQIPGYDRLLALGDQSWDNYEVTLSVTMNDIGTFDPHGVGGFGFGMLWNGHTDGSVPGQQPKQNWVPGASFVYDDDSAYELYSWKDYSLITDSDRFPLEEGATYNFKFRVEQINVFDRLYSLKAWQAGDPEPSDWLVQGSEAMSAPATGSLYLVAHYFDVTFGDLEVTEIPGNDIARGANGNDLLSAVDAGQANPGVGEIDVLVGGAGADTFVFGDDDGRFYDDGDDGSEGLDDFALIWDFASGVDRIQLAGSSGDYLLADAPSELASGTGIYGINPSGPDELIGIVNDVFGLSLASGDFLYEAPVQLVGVEDDTSPA